MTAIPSNESSSVEEDVGYWPDPDRTDQEKLREDLGSAKHIRRKKARRNKHLDFFLEYAQSIGRLYELEIHNFLLYAVHSSFDRHFPTVEKLRKINIYIDGNWRMPGSPSTHSPISNF